MMAKLLVLEGFGLGSKFILGESFLRVLLGKSLRMEELRRVGASVRSGGGFLVLIHSKELQNGSTISNSLELLN